MHFHYQCNSKQELVILEIFCDKFLLESCNAAQGGIDKGVASIFDRTFKWQGWIRRAWSAVSNLWAGGWWLAGSGIPTGEEADGKD